MPTIAVSDLKKYYQRHKKEPGFVSNLKSLFHREFETVKAVDDINFKIREGELVGFIGPNGAGKTTTLKVLSGLLYPTAGEVTVLGFVPWQRQEAFQKQFSFVTGQKNQLWWDLPPTETFLLNQAIYEIADTNYKDRLKRLSKMLDIDDLLQIPVRKLSLGQRMKAELVNALLHQPKVLFLDEPTIGLDVVAQERMRQFIADYNQQFAATIILTSHNMSDVERLAERVIVIDHGKLIFDGQLTDLVAKHAGFRVVNLTLERQVSKAELQALGEIKEYQYPKVSLYIDRANTKEKIDQILSDFTVVDLTVEEPEVEDVVREMFQRQ